MVWVVTLDCVTVNRVKRLLGDNPVWIGEWELHRDSHPKASVQRRGVFRFIEYDIGKPKVDPVVLNCIDADTFHSLDS